MVMVDSYATAKHWVTFGAITLRVTSCYSGFDPLRLNDVVHFASCPFAGPIALAYSNSGTTSWFISLRMSDGNILKKQIEIPDVFAMEWSRGQRLIVVDRRGHVSRYSPLGQLENQFSLGLNVREVRKIRLFPTTYDSGIALLDDQHRLFVVNSVAVSEPIVWELKIMSKEPVTTWSAFQPAKELTRLIVVHGREFYTGCPGEQLTNSDVSWAIDGEYTEISISADKLKIALYHSSGIIQVVTSDLSSEVSRLKVSGDSAINSFGWLGDECLFIQRSATSLQIYSIRDSETNYSLSAGVTHVGVEVDGIRLFGERTVQFIDIVSKEEQEVILMATTDGACLYDAAQMLEQGHSHKSYEYASQIKDMQQAIASCIKTATNSWNSGIQKSLLNAARFGMAFTNFETAKFMRVIRELRLLNALRGKQAGLPLSYNQFAQLGTQSLVNRMIDLEKYGLAIEVYRWIGGDSLEGVDRVLLEWVKRVMITASGKKNAYEVDFGLLDKQISSKLCHFPHVSIADAAEKAIEAKLPKLARLLIKRETSDYKQVQVLLRLDDVQEALSKAAAAQKPQLMHQVVRHLMKTHSRAVYELSIRKIPMAQCVYQELVKEEPGGQSAGRKMLALLEQASDFELQTLFHMDCASDELNTPDNRLNSLRSAKDSAHNLGDKGIEDVISELAAFMPGQVERSQDNLTIRETVIQFASDPSKISQFKHQAKLTDKQVWLWTIEGLAKCGNYERLLDIAQKKTPWGYLPFIKVCMKYNNSEECRRYLDKVTGFKDRIAAFTVMGNYIMAAQMAYSHRDGEALASIYNKAHRDKSARKEIAKLITSL